MHRWQRSLFDGKFTFRKDNRDFFLALLDLVAITADPKFQASYTRGFCFIALDSPYSVSRLDRVNLVRDTVKAIDKAAAGPDQRKMDPLAGPTACPSFWLARSSLSLLYGRC